MKKIASWGCDHLRLPVDFENIENDDGTIKEAGYEYIETCIKWCQKHGLNVVLDLHKTVGYIFDDPEYSAGFFEKLFAEAVQVAEEKGVSLYYGEYGVIDQAPVRDTVNLYRDINAAFVKNNIGRAAWSYKEMDLGLADDRMKEVIDEIIELLSFVDR